MGEFTPGPWRAEGDSIIAVLPNGAAVEIARSNPLKELRTASEYANALLIAAAPDMLEALQTLCSILNANGYGTDHANAAIARARGEQA